MISNLSVLQPNMTTAWADRAGSLGGVRTLPGLVANLNQILSYIKMVFLLNFSLSFLCPHF